MEIVKVESTDEEMLVIQKGTIKEYIKEYVKAVYYAHGHFNAFPHHHRIVFLVIPLVLYSCWDVIDGLQQGYGIAYGIMGGLVVAALLLMYITGNWKLITWPFLLIPHVFKLLLKKRLATLEFQGIAYRFTKAGYSMSLLRDIPNCDESCLEAWRKEMVGRQYTTNKENVVWVCEKKASMELIVTGGLKFPGLDCLPLCVFSTKDKNIHVAEEQLLRLGFEKQ